MPSSCVTTDYPLLASPPRRRRLRKSRRRASGWGRWALLGSVGVLGALGLLVYHEHQQTVAAPAPLAAPRPVAAARSPTKASAPAEKIATVPEAEPAPERPEVQPILIGEQWLDETVAALLEGHPTLRLSADEVQQVKEIYAYCQNVRTTYEGEIAELLTLSDTHARIRIPPYPKAGAKLEELWVEEMTAELGEGRFAEIEGRLGETFEVAFKGFGTSLQMLDVQLRRDPEEGLMYRIVARMDFYDPVDPAAPQTAGPLISTAARYDLRPETVATGEWRPLAKHFPQLPD